MLQTGGTPPGKAGRCRSGHQAFRRGRPPPRCPTAAEKDNEPHGPPSPPGVRGQVVPRAPITPSEWPELAHSAFQPPAGGRAHDEAAVAPAVFAATGALSRPGRSVLQINLRLLLRNP